MKVSHSNLILVHTIAWEMPMLELIAIAIIIVMAIVVTMDIKEAINILGRTRKQVRYVR